MSVRLVTFSGNECSLALFTGSSLIHSFNVKQVVFTGLQENPLLTAFNTWDGPRTHGRTHRHFSAFANLCSLIVIHQQERGWANYVPKQKPFVCTSTQKCTRQMSSVGKKMLNEGTGNINKRKEVNQKWTVVLKKWNQGDLETSQYNGSLKKQS